MHYTAEWQVMCIFKALQKNVNPLEQQEQDHYLTKEEFHDLYDIWNLKWKLV